MSLSWQSLLAAMHRVCNALEVQNHQSEVKLYIYKCTSNLILVSGERGENALLKKAKSTFFIILEKFSCKLTTYKMKTVRNDIICKKCIFTDNLD